MSSTVVSQRSHSPVDDDLQALYNQVWAGFQEEEENAKTRPAGGDLDNSYNPYGSATPRAVTAEEKSTTAGRAPISLPYASHASNPMTAQRQHHPHQRSPSTSLRRQLPPTPNSSSAAQPSFLMPEPEPYFEPSTPPPPASPGATVQSHTRPSHRSVDSYASAQTSSTDDTDLFRRTTASSMTSATTASSIGSAAVNTRKQLPVTPPVSSPHIVSGGPPADYVQQYGQSRSQDLRRGASLRNARNARNAEVYIPNRPDQPKVIETVAYDEYESPSSSSYSDSRESYLQPQSGGSYSASSYHSHSPSSSHQPSPQTSQSQYEYNPYGHQPQEASSSTARPMSHYGVANATYLDRTDSAQSSMPMPQPNYDENALRPDYATVERRPSDMLHELATYDQYTNERRDSIEPEEDGTEMGYWREDDDYLEEDELPADSFVNVALLSNMAVQLRDKVPRATHVKGSIPYPRAFTGKDIVSTIHAQLQRNRPTLRYDRRVALHVARSLQSQLLFYEVEWGGKALQDGVDDVYMFLGEENEGGSSSAAYMMNEELPTGVVTTLSVCYAPTCEDSNPCYSWACPRRTGGNSQQIHTPADIAPPVPEKSKLSWIDTVPKEIVASLPKNEITRQTVIHKIISKEAMYIQDINTVENVFIEPLKHADPPIISPPNRLNEFIECVFGNILDVRESNKRLLEHINIRQREQQYVVEFVGDIFLSAAAEFRLVYPVYMGNYPNAEQRLKEEMESNHEFRLFLEKCSRDEAATRGEDSLRLDLKHYLNRPSEHLQRYPVVLEAILKETGKDSVDAEYLQEAIEAIKSLHQVAQLQTFHISMGDGSAGKKEWHDLVSAELRASIGKQEAKRQAIIWELIKGEMAYVKDLNSIYSMYIEPLRNEQPPIIPSDRVEEFISEVFHNYAELASHHRRLMERFLEIQLEQHPVISSLTAPLMDSALNFRDAYMDYIPNYPRGAYRIDEEMGSNPRFKEFVNQCVRHKDAHRLDMKNFINRPIPRLLRYELLLKGILEETPEGHDDKTDIPHVIDIIKSIGKDSEPGVAATKLKVQLWMYNSHLSFGKGETMDLDLLNEHRSLVHCGKLLRQSENGLGWSELFVLLFDNYLVMTKPKERDGVTKYNVNRRPIPLELLTTLSFNDPPTQRGTGLLRNLRVERHAAVDNQSPITNGNSPEASTDSRWVYPLSVHHNGRMGGHYILFAESQQSRQEWRDKLEEALGIRKVVQESNKVFEVETLSTDTFLMPTILPAQGSATSPPAWNQESSFTGRVTCSVPFDTADGRGLVAIGCAEGVWIGFRHDPKSMRRVLHIKQVTQCAMLEEFGIFLVLADKSLFAYHIEALVPSSINSPHASQVPQKLNGTKDVHFFSVGQLHGRTLIIYMKKKGLDSIFRVLEPVGDKINERVRAPAGLGSRFGFRSAKSEWFRIYRDFFLPSESFDLIFLKARIAILCTKGFEIMDLNDFQSVTIPQRDDPRFASLAKRCESCKPLGMFRSSENEFLLCYDEFGVYVDKHGDPSRSAGTIEWEGRAERVALHHPYVLLFDTRFIEVRHVETGRLAQILPGAEVHCIWDGRGRGSSSHTDTPALQDRNGERMVQDAQVHAVMNTTELGSRGTSRAEAQHVFELIPTVPLYLPEPSPRQTIQSGYFPSPGHSPRDSVATWRS